MTFLGSEKAASEVIGHVIVLGLTITGISLISLVGIPTIYELQDMANVRNAEQAFTVMDSRVSAVILGNTPLQFLDVNLRGGTISVEPNGTSKESYMMVNISTDSENQYITVPMGKIKYRLGERIIAYEGGGVWSKYPSGGSVMLSPPEFHYNGVTLTLPVINISGTGSIGGSGSAKLKLFKEKNPVILYPNSSNPNQTNPVSDSGDGVYVTIKSEFYDAWADYAKSLGYTVVTKDVANSSVNIKLTVVPSTLGRNTSITNPITFRGLDGSDPTPLESWSLKIRLVGNNLNWDLRKSIGDKKLILYTVGSGLSSGDEVELSVGYQDDEYNYPAETWKTQDDYKLIVQEDSEGLYVDVDLLNTSRNLTYSRDTVGSNAACTPSKIGSGDFNSSGFSWGETLTEGSTEKNIYNITQHYIWLMSQEGEVSFNTCGSQTPSGTSTMFINYTSTGALSYLHISDNKAEVTIT